MAPPLQAPEGIDWEWGNRQYEGRNERGKEAPSGAQWEWRVEGQPLKDGMRKARDPSAHPPLVPGWSLPGSKSGAQA